MVAASRPETLLLLHVLGATVLVGAVAAATITQLAAGRSGDPAYLRRIGFKTLLFGALPAYVVMRIGGEWLRSKEFGEADDMTWIGIGYIVADLGALVLLVSLILSGIAARRSKSGLATAAGILSAILLVALLVAVWAMGAKPT